VSQAGLRSKAAAALAPLDRPLTSYYLIIGTTGLLLALGLVMVLSTSSAIQLESGLSPYSDFTKQLLGVAVGLPAMWLLSRARPAFFRAVASPVMLLAIVGLTLVLVFGITVGGGERWISVGGLRIQPSEFAKFAFCVWGADLLARKEKLGQLNDWRTLLLPLLPGAALLGMLVMLGDDLGTTFVLLLILLALLWVIGTPGRMFGAMLGLIGFMLLLLIVAANYRSARITGFLNPTLTNDWQLIQGKYAIGSGGWFGSGLGDSAQKWGWVPNPSTDFIFAILGEELGLIGTTCLVLLYGGLAYAGLRIARRVTDPFMRLASSAATAWIVGQALVNIGAVVGLLPITGVPLPLISEGLSSLLVTMVTIGMLLSFARQEPGASQALAARSRPGLSPWLRVRSRLADPGSQGIRRPDGPRRDGSRQGGPRRDGPRRDGPRTDGQRRDGPRRDGPRQRQATGSAPQRLGSSAGLRPGTGAQRTRHGGASGDWRPGWAARPPGPH